MLLVCEDVLRFDLFHIMVRYAFTTAADGIQQLTSLQQVLWESIHHCLTTLAGAGPDDQCRAIQSERSSLHCTH